MSERLTLEQIREFWDQQATTHGTSPAASWSDHPVIEMEIRQILPYLNDGDSVLDAGCANGYSTLQFAAQRRIAICGIDYIPEMITQAWQNLRVFEQDKKSLLGNVSFIVGDITDLEDATDLYDTVVVIRVIINLGEWDRQLQGLRECVRVLRPGGMLLLSEATVQGWQRLNTFRREWGLPDIPMPPFNTYLDQDQVIDALSNDLTLLDVANFSSTYYVGTRVLKPLLIQALGQTTGKEIDVADPDMEWNRWFASLPAWGDYGTQKLFVFRKKG